MSALASSYGLAVCCQPPQAWTHQRPRHTPPCRAGLQGSGNPSRLSRRLASNKVAFDSARGSRAARASSSDGDEGGADAKLFTGASGPSATEMHLMGVHTSASFRRSLHRDRGGYVRPLITLPPFVSRLLKQDIERNEAKYKAFDQVRTWEVWARGSQG